ncbi:MAG: OsmC family protein [Candidatus Marinimicrobia bacterium]|nr:OsmC family protein [Candidatus Neomarinimicrobiota bacterium]
MAIRHATAKWDGTLKDGNGVMKFGDYEGPFTFVSRFEEGKGTNPEELVGAAHAGCYSMFLSALLSDDKLNPTSIETTATVHLGTVDGAPEITQIDLECKAKVAGLDEDTFLEYTEKAKKNCPISKLFTGTEINLSAMLVD